MLCEFLGSDSANPAIARVMPPSLTLAVTEAAAGAWIDSSSRFAAQELRYLAQRRLEFAAQKLEESHDAVRAIALAAGYESEAAFSRAFKRAFGQPPAVWRRMKSEV